MFFYLNFLSDLVIKMGILLFVFLDFMNNQLKLIFSENMWDLIPKWFKHLTQLFQPTATALPCSPDFYKAVYEIKLWTFKRTSLYTPRVSSFKISQSASQGTQSKSKVCL